MVPCLHLSSLFLVFFFIIINFISLCIYPVFGFFFSDLSLFFGSEVDDCEKKVILVERERLLVIWLEMLQNQACGLDLDVYVCCLLALPKGILLGIFCFLIYGLVMGSS